jgi:hypothetical protein
LPFMCSDGWSNIAEHLPSSESKKTSCVPEPGPRVAAFVADVRRALRRTFQHASTRNRLHHLRGLEKALRCDEAGQGFHRLTIQDSPTRRRRQYSVRGRGVFRKPLNISQRLFKKLSKRSASKRRPTAFDAHGLPRR